MYDVSIIGAGVIGSAIARELSRYDAKICLIEKENDVSTGASKANSGVVHGGYAAKYGTLKGELCVKGNQMYSQLNKELDFGFKQTGALVIGFDDVDEKKIRELHENGLKVGLDDLEIIYEDRIREIEPHINREVKLALYCKNVGVTSPYEFAIALAENAIANGVSLKLETEVLGIVEKLDCFNIETTNESIESKFVVNSAGLYSDNIAKMVGINDFEILPRRGQYILLSKDQGHLAKTVVFQVPSEKGKGILVTSTYHGNFMIGPNAEDVDDKTDVSTSIQSIEYIIGTARKSIADFDIKKALTSFSGIRAISSSGDFIIEESKIKRFINVAGIDSPGLTSSPAIAEKVSEILKVSGLELRKKENFNPFRKAIFIKKDKYFHGKIDHQDPSKNIICRCENVTEAEIVDAIHREIPTLSTDSIKRRTRAGMGICQGNFCKSRVRSIMAREMNMNESEVTVRGKNAAPSFEKADINLIRKCKK